MNQKGVHKILSLAMAILLLLSTNSFILEKHFCGDVLIDTSIFSKANSCDVDETSKAALEKKSCCENELEIVKGQDKLKKASSEDLQIDQHFLITTFIFSYINLFEGLPEQVIPHKDYSPPTLVTDIQVLNQVFTI
ncbi:MAG TPA: hypothetical protein VNJ50_02500 [Gelidibacter sp.]|uniref:HYC_CC_PP family protein n=1 Tax=Gelidibacter sp. TaxID=2018083 RepID=UPI002B7EE5EE|nr:hypothetical protein [Gelidibacter sp.]HXJ97692.1 hypothetical protein [Gelidibacter sp.]